MQSQLPPTSHGSVLLVDDDRDLLAELTTAVADVGYTYLSTTDPKEALRLLEEHTDVEVVVSDIRMPGMDGLSMLSAIRERFSDRPWLQVIFITAHASVETVVSALRLEAVDFLQKPVHRQEIVEAVERAVRNAREMQEAYLQWKESGEQIARLGNEAARISEVLAGFASKTSSPALSARRHRRPDVAPPTAAEASEANHPISSERLLQLIQTRKVKETFFSGRLFADPILGMLLELMESRLKERPISVSSLCIASAIPISTALRRIEALEKEGLVVRVPDPRDGRRQFLELTSDAWERLVNYMTALDRELRRLS